MNTIEITTKGFCPNGSGTGAWIAQLKSGEHQREISGISPETTSIRIQLEAITEALKALKVAGTYQILVKTNFPLVVQSMPNRASRWEQNNWLRDNGEAIQHADLWKQILDMSKRHNITWEKLAQDDEAILALQSKIDREIGDYFAQKQSSETAKLQSTGIVRTLIICTPSEKAIKIASEAIKRAIQAGETILLYKHKQDNEAKFIQLATKMLYEKFIIAASSENYIPSTWPRLTASDDKHCLDQAIELADKLVLVHDTHDSTVRYAHSAAEFLGKPTEFYQL